MKSRSKYATFNMTIAVVIFFINGIVGLVNRMVLLPVVGAEIVGLSATFSDIMMFLNFADIGLSTAIGASLFEPIHNKKYGQIRGILLLFKKLYRYCGYVFSSLAVITTAVLFFTFKDPKISAPSASLYFILTAATTALSYFFSYRMIILNTDQSMFRLKIVNVGFKILSVAANLLFLIVTRSFTAYLVSNIVFTFLYYAAMNGLLKRAYRRAEESRPRLEEDTSNRIFRTVKGLVLHKVGEVAVYGTNNIYTSVFAGLTSTALLSNYQLIVNMLSGIIANMFAGFNSSLGDLVAVEDPPKRYSVFRVIFFLMVVLITAISVAFINCAQTFIRLCFGPQYVLGDNVVYLLTLYFFVLAIRPATDQFKTAAGIFYEDRFVPLAEAAVNTVACIILGRKFGILGVIGGNIFSTVAILSWQKPYMVFKYVFKTRLRYYFRDLVIYLAASLVSLAAAMEVCRHMYIGNLFLRFMAEGCVSVAITALVWLILFGRTKIFRQAVDMFKGILAHGKAVKQ
jgi:O-antigen/teichoic acid export membrane protein